MASVSMLLGEGIIKRGIPQRVLRGGSGMLAVAGRDVILTYTLLPWAGHGIFAVTGEAATLSVVSSGPLQTNLLIDYDIDSYGLTNGADITTWVDGSGRSKTLTGKTAHVPTNHTGGPNGKRYASFNGSQIALSVATDCMPVGTAERVMFTVFRMASRAEAAANIVEYGPAGVSSGSFGLGTHGGDDFMEGYFWSLNTTPFSVGDISQWHSVALQINSAGNPVWWIDGVAQAVDTGVFPNTQADILAIGGFNTVDGQMVGDIARVTGYGALTDPQISNVFTFLKSTYGTP